VSTILNPSTSPVTYSTDARVIAAGERLHDVTIDRITQAALDRGDLIEETEPETADEAAPVSEHEDIAPGVAAPEQAG